MAFTGVLVFVSTLSATVAMTGGSSAYPEVTTASPPHYANATRYYDIERRASRDSFDAGLEAWVRADGISPPPVPVSLASLPIPTPAPPAGRGGVAWLARTQGASRPRRPIRNGVEKKDGNAG